MSTLEGACSCGRNHYIIISPPSFQTFSVIYDNQAEHSRLSLRVPLSNLQSTTYAFYPDETHSSIRRVFIPRHAPHTKRHFCGFCGTPLTHWNEEGADWVHVNLGSLKSESVEKLVDEGLFESSKDTDRHPEGREIQGVSWFEEMIEGSKLGRIKQKGDGRSKVEWEVVEFSSEPNTGKRRRESDINGGESSK